MVGLNLLYNGRAKFKLFLSAHNFDYASNCLVRIYTSKCAPEEATIIAREIKSVLPKAEILGSSCCGLIFNGQQIEDNTLVVIESFADDDTQVVITSHYYDCKPPKQLAGEICASIGERSVRLMHLLGTTGYNNIGTIVENISAFQPGIRIVGGVVGGVVGDVLSTDIPSYLFTELGAFREGILVACYYGENLKVFTGSSTAHETISRAYTINKCDGMLLREIEGMDATKWCRDQFGMSNSKQHEGWQITDQNDALVRFPLVLEGHGSSSRFINYNSITDEFSISSSEIPSGTVFRIAYTSPTKCAQECFENCTAVGNNPIESLFCYTCLHRKMYLGNCAEWELRPYANCNISGVFMMGEIAQFNGQSAFTNGACCLVGIADREKYITPNLAPFEDMYDIRDDNEKLLSFVLQKQSVEMSRENQQLLEELLSQQERAREMLYVDVNTGISNTIKFSQDSQIHLFDKMCLIQIDNADLLIDRFGQAIYYDLLCDAIGRIRASADAALRDGELYYYMINSNTFSITATNSVRGGEFMNKIHALYDKYKFVKLGNNDELLINRFVVVLHQKNLIEKGLATLQNARHTESHFLIYDDSINEQSQSDVMEMLQVLNSAIERRKIIPYFQAIRDNNTGQITKYEALMRVQGEDGRIYTPYEFMDIAKRYHLYSTLSTLMLEQVFDLFAGLDTDVSINLSAFDINFETMRRMIFDKLEEMVRADNFVFEILEDEKFRDMAMLREFIIKARSYGVRIAIDDFGSGYSNFMEIARIEPDFIKVDGSIIRYVSASKMNCKVLESIVFLGNQLNAQLVAEFVENEDIQNVVERMKIHFSQGYYFAKPMPFEQLKLQ